MADIDLEKPGKILGSGLNAKDYTFIIMKDQPQYTAQSLAANPDCVTAADLLLKSPAIPDAGGNASFDIAAMANDLKAKMTAPAMSIKVAVVGTSKPTNEDPEKRLADLQTFNLLKGTPKLALDASSKDIKVGMEAIVMVQFQYLDNVKLTVTPDDVLHLSKTSLVKTDTLIATALKDGKATITATGAGGGTNLTEKLEIQATGLTVLLPGIGYQDPAQA